MSVATLESKRDLAIAALEAGDYADAIKYAMSAKLLLASMPNASRGAGGGSQSLAWNGSAIDDFITQCRQLATSAAVASGGIRQTKVTYARPESTDGY